MSKNLGFNFFVYILDPPFLGDNVKSSICLDDIVLVGNVNAKK